MNYQETIDYLFEKLPVYQHIGPGAYKPGLETARRLDDAWGNPSRAVPTLHIAGTNGKGSTAHTLASILQEAGYKVGLYTSPHIFDFRERIRVNGQKISQEFVVDFVKRWLEIKTDLEPSFFELTSAMAFEYFARQDVDVAVIETGLGGRLDSTNIIIPLLSIITNISLDHTALLGDTLVAIAGEKAGIIKPGIPVVVGEAEDPGVRDVFIRKAAECKSPIVFARPVKWAREGDRIRYQNGIVGELSGECQPRNAATVMAALPVVVGHFPRVTPEAIKRGFANVTANTGLMGRWTTLCHEPRVVIDTGHNIGGWQYIANQIAHDEASRKHLIMGFVADKDLTHILDLVAQIPGLDVYFSKPSAPRGLPAEELAAMAAAHGITGQVYPDVNQALASAMRKAGPQDLVVVAGSNFLIADIESPYHLAVPHPGQLGLDSCGDACDAD